MYRMQPPSHPWTTFKEQHNIFWGVNQAPMGTSSGVELAENFSALDQWALIARTHLWILVTCSLLVELGEHKLGPKRLGDCEKGVASRPLELYVRHLVHKAADGHECVLL